MGRPNRKYALDGKSYRVVEFHAKTGEILSEDPKDWLGTDEKFHEEDLLEYRDAPRKYGIEECSKEKGSFIVWEKSDELACPICTEGKSCFQKSGFYHADEVRKIVKDGKEKCFRFLVKCCKKQWKNYIFQQVFDNNIFESDGNMFLSRNIRVIPEGKFSGKCIFCPSLNIETKELVGEKVREVYCRGCRSFFFVSGLPVATEQELNDTCLLCKKHYSEPSQIAVDVDSVKGLYLINCSLCGGLYLCDCVKGGSKGIIEYACGLAEFKKYFPEQGKEL